MRKRRSIRLILLAFISVLTYLNIRDLLESTCEKNIFDKDRPQYESSMFEEEPLGFPVTTSSSNTDELKYEQLNFVEAETEVSVEVHSHISTTLQPRQNCKIHLPSESEIVYSNGIWQVLNGNYNIYLYSAFYDDRKTIGKVPMIRIFGISSIHTSNSSIELYCQLWFRNLQYAVIVPGWKRLLWYKSRKFTSRGNVTYMLSCPVKSNKKSNEVPFAVSVSREPCLAIKNLIKVSHSSNSIAKKRAGFGVCVKGLDFPNVDRSNQLIEWFELLKILGAEIVQVYNYAVTPETFAVLDFYSKQGFVKLINLTLPGPLPNDPNQRHRYLSVTHLQQKRQLEILPYMDCFYTLLYRVQFVTFLDIDEVIIPINGSSWRDIIESEPETEISQASSVQIRQNGCFFTGIKRNPIAGIPSKMYKTQYIHKIPRENGSFFKGTKAFFSTERILVAFNHWPIICLPKRCKTVKIDPHRAQLQHYKDTRHFCGIPKHSSAYKCKTLKCIQQNLNVTIDKTIWKYKEKLKQAFLRSSQQIFSVS